MRSMTSLSSSARRHAAPKKQDAGQSPCTARMRICCQDPFLSPLRNKRMDEYGGSLDNRARFVIEMIEEARRNVSPDFPIFLRISGDERMVGGNSLEDMLYLAPKFEAAGVSMLEVSAEPSMKAWNISFLARIKQGVNV